jgi:septum formation protein
VTEKHPARRQRPIRLASTSAYRRELLARFGLPFSVEAPRVDETRQPGEAPRALARRLALAKAHAVATRNPGDLVIGSDQVCALGDDVLGKPGTAERHRAMLAALSGRTAVFHTAVALVGIEAGVDELHVDDTRCVFRNLDPLEIEAYARDEPALDCAGGFKCESLGVTLLSGYESHDPAAIQGLPLIWLAAALRRAGGWSAQ